MTGKFQVKSNELLFNGVTIFRLDRELTLIAELTDSAIILFGGDRLDELPLSESNRNILRVLSSGQTEWQIENKATYFNPYVGAQNLSGVWYAYTFDDYRYRLNVNDGSVSSIEFVPQL